jgi:hypothetical protein
MKKLMHPNKIDELYNNSEISINEASKLRDAWENSTEDEKNKNLLKSFASKKNEPRKEEAREVEKIYKLSELSEKELLVEILKINNNTNGWITFLGWVVLIGIIFNIVMALLLLA